MSDLCMQELEDIFWDQLGENDDCIVPCTADECEDQIAGQAGYKIKGGRGLIPMSQKDSMLERKPLSQSTNGALSDSYDIASVKDMEGADLEDPKMADDDYGGSMSLVDSEFCTSGPLLADGSTAGDNSLYNYSLDHISQAGKSLRFFDNGSETKENGDLFYDWPDIGNFEDVDKMFRSCDSTFGMGSLCDEDDLRWFSPSQAVERSENVLLSDSKLKKVLEVHGCLEPEVAGPSSDVSNGKSVIANDCRAENADASGCLSITNVSDGKSQDEKGLISPKQAFTHDKKQIKHLNQSKVKNYEYSENGSALNHNNYHLEQVAGEKQNDVSTFQNYSSFKQHGSIAVPMPLNCATTSELDSDLIYDHSPDQMSVCHAISGIKSGNHFNQCPSNGSSYASNRAQSTESVHGSGVEVDGAITLDKSGKLQQNQDFFEPLANSFSHGLLSVQKQMHPPKQDIEGQAEVKGAMTDIPGQLDSSSIPESSCVSSAMNEFSLEATSFRQLQQVVEQLDIRTKLCIRDSLYRLAKSAEQRHNCPSGGTRDDRDAGLTPKDATSKYAGFLDIETHTNPIDRSIAHLLFHRPSDSSLLSSSDVLPSKSQAMIVGSTASPHLMVEKQEETSIAGADNNV